MIIIPVVGIHTSGKSELIKHARALGFDSFSEIAQTLVDQGYALGENGTEFLQRLIMEREIARDATLESRSSRCVCIETWHIGNLAHVQIVAPNLYDEYANYWCECLKKTSVHCVLLELDPNRILERTRICKVNEPRQLIKFHAQVLDNIHRVLKDFDIPFSRINANAPLESVKSEFENVILKLS